MRATLLPPSLIIRSVTANFDRMALKTVLIAHKTCISSDNVDRDGSFAKRYPLELFESIGQHDWLRQQILVIGHNSIERALLNVGTQE